MYLLVLWSIANPLFCTFCINHWTICICNAGIFTFDSAHSNWFGLDSSIFEVWRWKADRHNSILMKVIPVLKQNNLCFQSIYWFYILHNISSYQTIECFFIKKVGLCYLFSLKFSKMWVFKAYILIKGRNSNSTQF